MSKDKDINTYGECRFHCEECGFKCLFDRAPELDKFLDNFVKETFGTKRDGSQCVTCGSKKVSKEDFKDELSYKEYQISYMCQACQDSTFCPED